MSVPSYDVYSDDEMQRGEEIEERDRRRCVWVRDRRRSNNVDTLEYELPANFKDEEISEDEVRPGSGRAGEKWFRTCGSARCR